MREENGGSTEEAQRHRGRLGHRGEVDEQRVRRRVDRPAARAVGRTSILLLVKRGPNVERFIGVDIAAR